MIEFEWDPEKERLNVSNHQVLFAEAASVFWDMLALTYDDPDHSDEEERYVTFGLSNQSRFLVVVHTDRGDRIRIISARVLKPAERKAYERKRYGQES